MKIITKIGAVFLLLIVTTLSSYSASSRASVDTQSAVILMYHHISATTPPSTSISPDLFAEHLAYIDEHFVVKPLEEVIDALQRNNPLAPNTLVITFDDGYSNIKQNGHSLLKKYDFPYTIFINPARISSEAGQLTWQEVKTLAKEGVSFANHTTDHLHMLDTNHNESEAQWLNRVWNNVENAQNVLVEKLGDVPKYLAYPYGEYNQTLAEKVLREGYVGFGQHSGGISYGSNFAALPRFPAAGIYASLRSLKTKMHSLAMPVSAYSPSNPEITQTDSVNMSFIVNSDDVRLSQLQCFYKGSPIEVALDQKTGKVSTSVPGKLPIGRSRVNCTAPSKSLQGRFYWYSQPFFVANEFGKYPD